MECFPINNPCHSYPDTKCIVYTGISLPNIGVSTNDRLAVILASINTAIGAVQSNSLIFSPPITRTGLNVTWTGTTTNVPEGTRLYYTDTRARNSISLTTTGISGPSTYTPSTGVLNVPTYTAAGLGAVPLTRTITINGNTQDLSIDRTWTLVLGVSSVFGRVGAVVATSGDYNTSQVTENTNLYYTDTRARSSISLTAIGSSGAATYTPATGIINIPIYAPATGGSYVAKVGDTMTGALLMGGAAPMDSVLTVGVDTLNIGTSNADVINLGWAGSTINITGTLSYQNTTNLAVKDKLFRINVGGGVNSGVSSGFEIEENAIATGYFATNSSRNGWDFKAPGSQQLGLGLDLLTVARIIKAPDASGTLLLDSRLITINGISATLEADRTFTITTTGTINRITVTNPSTNPVIDIASTYVGQISINTLGTITTGVWNGTAIANANLANSVVTIGTTSISLGGTSTTLAGLTSVTSTSFVGALTGNASTVTTNANLTGPVTSVGNATTIAAGAVTNANLVNSTISGIALGGTLAALTIGTDLSGTSYNGSSAVTINNTATLASVTGRGASTSTGLSLTQNGNLATSYSIYSIRNTDVSPLGFFLQFRNNAQTANLFTVDVAGNVIATQYTGNLVNSVTAGSGLTGGSFNNSSNITFSIPAAGVTNAMLANSTISGTALGGTLPALTFGTYLTGGSYNGAGAVTLATNATALNTASTLVARDASGNFAAGTITALLAGNSTTATSLQTARLINGVSFNGSTDITIAANTTNTLTIGTGLSGGSFNGSAPVTIANTGVLSNIAGTDITVSGATGNVTIGTNSTLQTVTGRGNTTTNGISITENGNLAASYALYLKRNTDVSPLGYLIQGQNAAATVNLFTVDVAGNVVSSGTYSGNLANTLTFGGGLNAGTFNNSGASTVSIATGGVTNAMLANNALSVNGVAIALGSSGTITANTQNSLTMNNAGTGAASGTTFNGGTAQTISYNTIGAPSTTGANASGTWGINVTGTASGETLATVTGRGATTSTAVTFNGGHTSISELLSGVQPAALATSGTAATSILNATGGKGGNTTGTTGQVAGAGSLVSLVAGNGGDAPAGSTNGNGGNLVFQSGVAGAGAGTAGSAGTIQMNIGGTPRYTINADGSNTWTGSGQFGGNVTINNGSNSYLYGQTTNSFVRLDNAIGAQLAFAGAGTIIADGNGVYIGTGASFTNRFQINTAGAATFSGLLTAQGNLKMGAAFIPAFAGANDIALPNNMSIRGANAANSTGFSLIKLNSSDEIHINSDGATLVRVTGSLTTTGAISGGAGSFTTGAFTGAVTASASVAGYNTLTVRNTSTATNAAASVDLGNDLSTFRGELVVNSSTYTPSGIYRADGVLLYSGGAGGITIAAQHTSGGVFINSGESLRYTISSAGDNTWTGSGTFGGLLTTSIAAASPQVAVFAGSSGTPYITVGTGSNAGGYINYNTSTNVWGLGTHGNSTVFTVTGITGNVTGGAASFTTGTFTSSVTASSFIKTGANSTHFLKGDGSSDGNTYLTTSSAATTYAPISGSTNYIQNTTTVQAGSNFNISGNGVIGGTLNVTSSVTGVGVNSTQNGNLATSYGLYLKRNTDTSPLGFLIQGQNAAANSNLFTVDVSGNVVAAGNVTAVSFLGNTAILMAPGTLTGSVVILRIQAGGVNYYVNANTGYTPN